MYWKMSHLFSSENIREIFANDQIFKPTKTKYQRYYEYCMILLLTIISKRILKF